MATGKQVVVRRKKFEKKDISSPESDFTHLGHIGPDYLANHQRSLDGSFPEMHLPTPCQGKVNEATASVQTTQPVAPEGGLYVDKEALHDVQKTARHLHSLAMETMESVKNVAHSRLNELERNIQNVQYKTVELIENSESLTKQLTKLSDDEPSPCVAQHNKSQNQNRMGVHIGSESNSSLYVNTPEGVAAEEKGANRDIVNVVDKESGSVSCLYENTVEGVAARDGYNSPVNIKQKNTANAHSSDKDGTLADDCTQGTAFESLLSLEDNGITQNSMTNPTYSKNVDGDVINGQHTSTEMTGQSSESQYALKKRRDEDVWNTWSLLHQASLNAKHDDRECLSEALRVNTVDIIENVLFGESELPDELTADGCITEDECDIIRKFSNRKDQTRVLLSTIRGRDNTVLTMFLARVKKANPDVAQKILASCEYNKRHKVRPQCCPRCMLIERVNVRFVSDSLFAIHAIDDTLYNEIIFDIKPAGAQKELWNRVMDSVNALQMKKHRKLAIDKVRSALKSKNYNYIFKEIERITQRTGEFPQCNCTCTLQFSSRGSDPVDYFSPRSSVEVLRDSKEILSATECKEAIQDFSLRSPERERRHLGSRNNGSISDEDLLEPISEDGEPGKEHVVRKTPKPKPRKQNKQDSAAEDTSFA